MKGAHSRSAWRALPVVVVPMVAGCSLAGLDSEYGTDASSEQTEATDAPSSDAPSSDSTADSCNRPENCTNGVDDNCNHLVDCADPECMEGGYACTAGLVPSGWTLVAYSGTTRPECPASYGSEQALVSGVAAQPASCGCSCSGTGAKCGGNTSLQEWPNACATGLTSVTLAVNNGACSSTSFNLVSNDFYTLPGSSPQAIQGTCSGSGTVMGKPAPTFDAGATCSVASQLGGGCTNGACAPPTGTAFKTCISHPGNVACPQFGFTQQVLASTGTPGYVDTRACSSCACGTSLSCGAVGSIALWPTVNCTSGAADTVTSAGCEQYARTAVLIRSYTVGYSTSGSASCQPTGASTGTGGVALDSNVETICCAD